MATCYSFYQIVLFCRYIYVCLIKVTAERGIMSSCWQIREKYLILICQVKITYGDPFVTSCNENTWISKLRMKFLLNDKKYLTTFILELQWCKYICQVHWSEFGLFVFFVLNIEICLSLTLCNFQFYHPYLPSFRFVAVTN